MNEPALFFKILPYVIYFIGVFGAITAGTFVYLGITSRTERSYTRLRIKQTIKDNKEKLVASAKKTGAEDYLKQADYPLGINGVKYYTIFIAFITFLTVYYVIVPMFTGGGASLWMLIAIIVIGLILHPGFPFSLFRYVIKRIIDYKQAKKSSEVFMLYDLLINEIEMMTTSRVNTYNLIRGLKPYFDVINRSLTKLLTTWSNDEGPSIALDRFAEDIGTKEAKALTSVLRTLDENDRETALSALKGMSNMFVRTQIENYRRRRKVMTDIGSIPIKVTHFLILLNFMAVVVMMVSYIMRSAHT